MKKRAADTATPVAIAPTPTPAPAETPQASADPVATPHSASAEEGALNGVEVANNPEQVVKDGAVAQTIEQGESAPPEQLPQEVSLNPLACPRDLWLTSQQSNEDVAQDGEAADDDGDEDLADDKSDIEIITERPESEMLQNNAQQQQLSNGADQNQTEEQDSSNMMSGQQQQGFDFNQAQQGFGNMDFSAMNGFNPMMAMQNGMMGGFGMGGMPNMMGKHYRKKRHFQQPPIVTSFPGMPMDPSQMMGMMNNFGAMGDMSAMMGMMGNGGFPGMGNGMNMGMNNGFNGASAGGYNNRFGNNHYQNQQQQPFHPNARGGFNRPYGRGNRGFRGGYGNGFAGRGRGGFNQLGNQGYQNGFQQQNGFHGPNGMSQQGFQQQQGGDAMTDASAEPGAGRGSPTYEPMKGTDRATSALPDAERTNETGADTNNAGAGDNGAAQNGDGAAQGQDGADAMDTGGKHESSQPASQSAIDMFERGALVIERTNEDATAGPMQTEQAGFDGAQNGQNFYENQDLNFGSGNQGLVASQQPIAPPVNAPTGPKAMRQGLPNSGFYSRPQPSQTPSIMNAKASGEHQGATNGHGSVRGRSADRHGYDDDRDRDNDRSRSRHRSKKHDRSRDDDDYESDATYERRKERERRKRKERERRYEDEDRETGRSKSGKVRSRTASPTDDSSHRRHRDKDAKRSSRRDRSRDKLSRRDEEDDSSRKKSKTHRSCDDEDDYGREKEKDKGSRRDRGSRRDYDDDRKDRSSKHSRHTSRDRERSDRKHSAAATVDAPSDEIGFKIKGSHSSKINPRGMPPPSRKNDSSRRDSDAAEAAPAAVPKEDMDPYAAERERHKQERALREQQRRLSSHGQGSTSQGLGKRGREEPEETGSGKKRRSQGGRRISAKYEGEIDAGSGERERERERWR